MSRRRVLAALALATLACWLVPREGHATIEEQRARLPPPAADCTDPVEGVWLAHQFDAERRPQRWHTFTLEIKRVGESSRDLEGTILGHFWNGTPADKNTPPCRPGGYESMVRMPAKGTIEGQEVTFWGTSWTREAVPCGSAGGYNLDKFSGKIDPKILEFQSVNNDGGESVNEPHVFRRIRCLDNGPRPSLNNRNVVPPPFVPPERGACARRP